MQVVFDPQFDAFVEAHRGARAQQSAYYEKLALLNGAKVALVVTAVIGPLRGHVPHRYTLGAGLCCLVLALLALLYRNLLAARYEYPSANASYAPSTQGGEVT